MVVKDLGDVFVASGIEMVNDVTFTALFYGYEVRGKVVIPSAPSVEFFFYGNVYIDNPDEARAFVEEFDQKFGKAKFRFSDKFVSIMFDIGSLDAAAVKERLGAVGMFMINNGFGAIALQPEEPEPEPEPEPKPVPAPVPQQKQQKPQPQVQHQTQQPKKQPPQQPVYEEPKTPFEDYQVLQKLTEMFLLGVNKVTNNTFTTIYHGYNVVGKMLSPDKDDVELIFYGALTQNVGDEFEEFKNSLTEKYQRFPIRMVGGSCDAIFYLDGKEISECKEMLGEVSGFMMRNSIVAVNLPNTIGRPVATYTAEALKALKGASSSQQQSSYNRSSATSMPSGYVGSSYGVQTVGTSQGQSGDGEESFVNKFLKKFGNKP